MSYQQVTDKESLLDNVPKDGSAIGNVTLRKQLAWDEDKYWAIRDELIDEEKLTLGKGKGGSVRRTPTTTPVEDVSVDEAQDAETETMRQDDEASLYPKIEIVLREKWSKEYRLEDFFVQQTAKQGRRETGGKWTRPDLVIVSVTAFQNLPGKFVDVSSFEVKAHNNFDVTAIYEALAHLRAATRAYVLISVPSEFAGGASKELDTMEEEASRHGIGLIIATDVSLYSTWDVRAEPQVKQPDPGRLDEFLETQIVDENRKKLRKWIK